MKDNKLINEMVKYRMKNICIYEENDSDKDMRDLWQKEEIQVLKDNYIKLGGAMAVQSLLPWRSHRSILGKARGLGLRIVYTQPELHLSELEKAYIAGIMDGEGFIGLIHSYRAKRQCNHFQPKVDMSNTDERLIDWLKTRLSSLKPFVETKPARDLTNQKPVHHLMLFGPERISIFLEQIIPYMIIKKEMAEILLKYTKSRLGLRKGSPYTIDPEKTYQLLRSMNQKGLRPGERQ